MKNNPTSQILSILFLLLMCAGIVVSVIFYRKLQESNGKLQESNEKLQESDSLNAQLVKNLEVSRDSTRQILEALKNNEIIIAALQPDSPEKTKPPKSVPSNGHPSPAPAKPVVSKASKELSNILERAQAVDNSLYEVAVYAYNCPRDLLPKAAAYFTRNGYRLSDTATLRASQSWLAGKPSVIYYGNDNKRKASALASDLKLVTGIQFQTMEGAGYGVPKEVQPYTFKIHLVR